MAVITLYLQGLSYYTKRKNTSLCYVHDDPKFSVFLSVFFPIAMIFINPVYENKIIFVYKNNVSIQ